MTGGASLTRQQNGSDQTVFGVWFVDDLRGIAVRNGVNAMLRTTDGGVTWTPLDVRAGDLRAVSFADDQHGFAVGSAVFRTDDGGAAWTSQAVSARGEFLAVHLQDANRATMVGEYGKIFQTTDGAPPGLNATAARPPSGSPASGSGTRTPGSPSATMASSCAPSMAARHGRSSLPASQPT